MQLKHSTSLLLLLFVASVTSHAKMTSTEYLQCYVCDNCASIQNDTPVISCNEEYFKTGGITLPATMTTTTEEPTTEMATTTPSMESTRTTEMPTTTTMPETTASTTMETTTTVGSSTQPPVPTPVTVGPASSTTALPTPINPGSVQVFAASNETHANSTILAAVPLTRSRRQAIDTIYTYHCYSAKKNDSGTLVTQRGCSRVTTGEAVCSHLQALNNGTQLSKCVPCSMNECNGSGALSVTALTLLVAVVAALVGRE